MSTASVELHYPAEYYEPLPPVRGFGTSAGGRAVLAGQLDRARSAVREQVRREAHAAKQVIEVSHLAHMVDKAWQVYRPNWTRHVLPQVMAAYGRGFIQSKSGRVPERILVPIAQDYADKLGDYFNETSAQALAEGYQALLNRRVPAQLALDTALNAYGLTSRQMRAYVAMEGVPKQKVSSINPLDLKRKAKEFVGRALRDRFKVFAKEEMFKAEQHAHQLVWMFENRSGRLPPGTKRMWITADDEKVCPLCGPLHKKKVDVEEPFVTKTGEKIWTPGLHVNCRCSVRLWVPHDISKADAWDDEDERLHPRDPFTGEFTRAGTARKKPSSAPPVKEEDPFLRRLIETTQVQTPKPIGAAKPIRVGKPIGAKPIRVAPIGVQSQAKPVTVKSKPITSPIERRQRAIQAQQRVALSAEKMLDRAQEFAFNRAIRLANAAHRPITFASGQIYTHIQELRDSSGNLRPVALSLDADEVSTRSHSADEESHVFEFDLSDGLNFYGPGTAGKNAIKEATLAQMRWSNDLAEADFPVGPEDDDFNFWITGDHPENPFDGSFVVSDSPSETSEDERKHLRYLRAVLQDALNRDDAFALDETYPVFGQVHQDWIEHEFTGHTLARAMGLTAEDAAFNQPTQYVFTVTAVDADQSIIADATHGGEEEAFVRGSYWYDLEEGEFNTATGVMVLPLHPKDPMNDEYYD